MRVRSPRDVGALVRDRRKALGVSQEALAAQVGVSRRWIVALEGGKPTVELGLVLRVLAALGVWLRSDAAPPPTKSDIDRIMADLDELL